MSSVIQQDIAQLARQNRKEAQELTKLLTTLVREFESLAREQEHQTKQIAQTNKQLNSLEENIVKLLTAFQVPKTNQ